MSTTGPSDMEMPRSADEMATFLDGLTFTDAPVELPPALEPDDEPLVVRSLRLPLDVETRARAIAEQRGIKVTTLMREWVTAAVIEAEGVSKVDDPVGELGRILTEVNRAYQVVAHRRDAA
jgi:hypothetical protein